MPQQTLYTPDLSTFGKRLAHWLIDAGITQYELAEKLGVSAGSVSAWCVDRYRPETDTLLRLSEITGFSIDYLLCGPNGNQPTDVTPATDERK